jgi:hypothetical protein
MSPSTERRFYSIVQEFFLSYRFCSFNMWKKPTCYCVACTSFRTQNTTALLQVNKKHILSKQSYKCRYVCSSPKLISPKYRSPKFDNLHFGEVSFRRCYYRQCVISAMLLSTICISAILFINEFHFDHKN